MRVIAVTAAWIVGAVLLAWATAGGPPVAAEWALYLSAANATATVVIALAKSRQRLAAAFARELMLHQQRERHEDDGGVVQLH